MTFTFVACLSLAVVSRKKTEAKSLPAYGVEVRFEGKIQEAARKEGAQCVHSSLQLIWGDENPQRTSMCWQLWGGEASRQHLEPLRRRKVPGGRGPLAWPGRCPRQSLVSSGTALVL